MDREHDTHGERELLRVDGWAEIGPARCNHATIGTAHV
jgi:hypothetical protein